MTMRRAVPRTATAVMAVAMAVVVGVAVRLAMTVRVQARTGVVVAVAVAVAETNPEPRPQQRKASVWTSLTRTLVLTRTHSCTISLLQYLSICGLLTSVLVMTWSVPLRKYYDVPRGQEKRGFRRQWARCRI
eukprot:Rmarinus@m.13764